MGGPRQSPTTASVYIIPEFPLERNSAELEREGVLGRYSSPATRRQGKSEELAGVQKKGLLEERERGGGGERERAYNV